jgi:threonine dehydratase
VSVAGNSLLEQIDQAVERIAPHARVTPLEPSSVLQDQEVYLKCEHLQHTGSFKFRGALNRILALTDEERSRGVIAASSGNHGQGVALAGRIAGAQCTVYVPDDVVAVKRKAIERLGATVVEVPGGGLQAELRARDVARSSGCVFVSPYNDELVVAGQGTIGVELYEQLPDVDAVFISVGGGGLISGIGSYLKSQRPDIKIFGCWPENSPVMLECMKRGAVWDVPEFPTISDGTAGGIEANAITLDLCQQVIDEHVLVSESEIIRAMSALAERDRFIVEGAAGVALAGCLQFAEQRNGRRSTVVLCGRNIDFEKFTEAVQR